MRISEETYGEEDVTKTAQFYDAVHLRYEDVKVFSEHDPYTSTFGLLRDRIRETGISKRIRDGVVLDAGCGAWQKGTRVMRDFSPRRCEAVDLNERSLDHCREDPQPNTTYSRQDVANLDFDDETFDFIVCEGVVQHTIDPVKTLDELLRVLKPGGNLTLGIYCWRFPYAQLSKVLKRTIGRKDNMKIYLEGTNKIKLILADLIFVPIEHFVKLKKLIEYFDSRDCRVIYNDLMWWPIPGLGNRGSKAFYWLTGLHYRHIFVEKPDA